MNHDSVIPAKAGIHYALRVLWESTDAVVFDSTGSYRGAFISLGLVAILASLLLWTARRPAPPQTA